jgi:catechol O-methyltransferase
MRKLTEIGGRHLPFLRWSAVRMAFAAKRINMYGQVGDGREEQLARVVESTAREGDIDDAIRVIDEFCYERSAMMNIGDEKGEILDSVVTRLAPLRLLELGTYCGYSALRTARAMPQHAVLWSVERNPDNAAIARRILDHAGVGARVRIVTGSLGDGGGTAAQLSAAHGFEAGNLDFVFIDHDKAAYLADLRTIVELGWLHTGSVVVADNVGVPGAPGYREYMRSHEGSLWRTREHHSHLEYQTLIKDLVLESELL